jgi:hypothetical protein
VARPSRAPAVASPCEAAQRSYGLSGHRVADLITARSSAASQSARPQQSGSSRRRPQASFAGIGPVRRKHAVIGTIVLGIRAENTWLNVRPSAPTFELKPTDAHQARATSSSSSPLCTASRRWHRGCQSDNRGERFGGFAFLLRGHLQFDFQDTRSAMRVDNAYHRRLMFLTCV